MVDDLVDLVRPPVVPLELRRVGVDDVGIGGDAATDERAEVAQLGIGPLEILGGTIAAHACLQIRIELVPVLADDRFERCVVDHGSSIALPHPLGVVPFNRAPNRREW